MLVSAPNRIFKMLGARLNVLTLCILILLIKVFSEPVPSFPLQFSATITITAHLIEPENEYPPRSRSMTVYYDYIRKLARVDIEAGYEAAKTYIRRYDSKNEYMVRLDPINDCKRSYLGELMPFPDLPDSKFIKQEMVNGILCNYFLHEDYDTRIHIYMEVASGAPYRLVQESVDVDESVPLLTYDYSNVNLGPPRSSLFELPQPYVHNKCDRHVGGFPYQHIFHHFVRF